MTVPYFDDGTVRLYLGRFQDVLPTLTGQVDLVVADPPYAETALEWDRWPDGWPALIAGRARSMWCFGSMRMFLDRRDEFTGPGWHLSQDVVWEKHNGAGFAADRFKRVHEHAAHWYRGGWDSIHHETPHTAHTGPDKSVGAGTSRTPHTGRIGAHRYEDDGTRLARSVQRAPSVRGGLSPTEKPVALLRLLIEYGCPPGALVLDPFAGSGSTLEAARLTGRRAIGIEADAAQIEKAARRLSQGVLEAGAA